MSTDHHLRQTLLTLLRRIALLTLLLSAVPPVTAQQQITIINADRAEGEILDGEPVRKLLGNVILEGENLRMEADSAYQYSERNRIDAFSIEIESPDEIIWADTLFYNTLNDFSRFRGRVILRSESATLFSHSIDYDRLTDRADFHEPVRLEDRQGVLLADSGYYFQEQETGYFRGNVQVADTTQYLEADSLRMDRRIDYYELFRDIYAEDFEERVTLAGDYLEVDGEGYRFLSGDAWMMQVSEDLADTTHLTASEIHLTETDTSDFVDAYGDVEIWAETYAARSDSSHYRSDLDRFELREDPIVWREGIQLTGPYIEAHFEEDEISFLTSYTRPIAVLEDSATGRFNQMKGDTLNAWFEQGEIVRLMAYDDSEMIYHLKNDEDEPDGLIELNAAGPATILFVGGEPDRFKAEQNVEGSHLPEDPQNVDRRLSGFRWDPDLKPLQPEIRTPRLPPVPDERPFELPDRYLRYIESLPDDRLQPGDQR